MEGRLKCGLNCSKEKHLSNKEQRDVGLAGARHPGGGLDRRRDYQAEEKIRHATSPLEKTRREQQGTGTREQVSSRIPMGYEKTARSTKPVIVPEKMVQDRLELTYLEVVRHSTKHEHILK